MRNITLLILLLSALYCDSQKPVRTKDGIIYGMRLKKYRKTVTGYFGIPFAKPPIGKLRFKPPEPLEKNAFKKGFYANRMARTCFYRPRYTGFIGFDYWHPRFLKYSEDCLQLNMWVPKRPNGAVLVYIFGRAYHSGSPSLDMFNGAVIAAKTRTIVVNINYRLDILGFAFLGSGKEIPGNVGLLDQQMALKWVYNNVKYFGGHKDMITVFGHGTGAASVTAHLFSEKSSKYIKRVALFSGTLKNTWAYQSNRIVSENVDKLAKSLGCGRSEKEILRCLQSVDVRRLVEAANKITHPEQSPLIHSFTIVENDDLFFRGNVTKKMYRRDMKHKFDVLIGKTSDEATYFMPQYLDVDAYGCNFDPRKPVNSDCNACKMNKTNFDLAVKLLSEEYYLDNQDTRNIDKVYSQYEKPEYRDKAARLISDFTFDCDIVQYAKYISSFVKGRKYFFEYRTRSSSNPWPRWMGAMHAYELEFFFGMPFRHVTRYNRLTYKFERDFSERLVHLLGDFAFTGKPEPYWKQFNKDRLIALVIDKKLNIIHHPQYVNVFTNTCKIHDNILKKYPAWGRKFNNLNLKRHT
uniref:Acetylcholinesterase n=1 Tax=Strongyloides papillosus TaxID=174720 RepID=A0A0N5BNG9_STREA